MQTVDLTNHFLIAMPAMADPFFSKTLTYICEHNEQGALGLVVPLTAAVPEPGTYALMLSGLGLMAWFARRQRR